jgi:hypothetical protein
LFYDRGAVPWKSWLAGASPWLFAVLGHSGAIGSKFRIPNAHFYLWWVTQPFGFGIDYTLGRGPMLDYLKSPLLAGHPTYLMAFVHLVLASLLVVIAVQAIRTTRASGWPAARAGLLGASPEALLITATVLGYGGSLTLLTVFGAGVHRHYLIVVAPVLALWGALAVLYGNPTPRRARAHAILLALCIGQATVSAGLLSYIHRTALIKAAYGATWRSQQSGFVAPGQ